MSILNNNYFDLCLLILSSIIVGLIMTRISLWIAKKLEIIDYPGRSVHNIHKKPIPRAGGIAILLSLSVLVIANRLWSHPEVIKILLPSLVVFTFGLWDDKHGMKALTKLIGQLLAVTVLVLFDVRVEFLEKQDFFIHLDSNLAYWADVCITYFWMVGITNAINIVDSMDGIGIGLTQIYSAFFLFLSMISDQVSLIYLSAIIFGLSWGVSFFNRRPAKIFLGDSGTQSLGFILAAIAILYSPKTDIQSSSWFTPIIFFSIPIIDTTLVTISRTLRGKPFYKAGLDHTFHRMVALGWDQNRSVSLIHLISIIMCFVSICVIYVPPLSANLFFLGWVLLAALFLFILEKNYIETKSTE